MAEGVDIGHLRSMLECSVCLEQYENPKMLKCTHEFCKECLEEILQFNADGSASITCPMRCTDKTTLNSVTTVNDLATSFIAKNILESLKTTDANWKQQMPQCRFVSDCTKRISCFCCNSVMCTSCYSKHVSGCVESDRHSKVNLSFNKRSDEVAVLCDQHSTICTHACQCENRRLLCMYCMHRDKEHGQHEKIKLDLEVTDLQEAFTNQLSSQQTILDKFESMTQEKIPAEKEKFVAAVRRRKELCLQKYKELVNEEEKLLIKKFDETADQHMKQYRRENSSVTGYYRNLLYKRKVELALMKKEITEKLEVDRCSMSLKKIDLQLSGDFDFLSKQPLGKTDAQESEDVVLLINSPVWSTFTCTPPSDETSLAGVGHVDEIVDSVQKVAINGPDPEQNSDEGVDVLQMKAQGNEFFKKSMYEEAIKCYSTAIQECPKDNGTDLCVFYQNRAAANEKLKRWELVVHDCTTAIQFDSKYCKALHRRAKAHLALGRKGAYLDDATLACMIERYCNKTAVELAKQIATDLGEKQAMALIQERGQFVLFPNSYFIIQSMRDYAQEDSFEIPLTNHMTSGDARFMKVLDHMRDHDFASAFHLCNQEITSDGKHKMRATLLRGVLRSLIGDGLGAEQDYQAVIQWSTKRKKGMNKGSVDLAVDAYCSLADKRKNEGQWAECFDFFERAVMLDSNNYKIYYRRGRTLRNEAVEDFEKAISLNPNFIESHIQLAMNVCFSGCPQDKMEAIDMFEKALRRFPQSAKVWCDYGVLLLANRMDGALQKFDKALALDRSLLEAYEQKSNWFIREKDYDSAEKVLKTAIEVYDKWPEFYDALGCLQARKCQFEEAVASFEKAIPLITIERELKRTCGNLVSTKVQCKVLKQHNGSLPTLPTPFVTPYW